MKVLAPVCMLGLVLSSALNAAPVSKEGRDTSSLALMQCTAGHPGTDETFYGIGLKFVGASLALRECRSWAEEASLETSDCFIVSCEEVQEPL